jgi:hypothetical protein
VADERRAAGVEADGGGDQLQVVGADVAADGVVEAAIEVLLVGDLAALGEAGGARGDGEQEEVGGADGDVGLGGGAEVDQALVGVVAALLGRGRAADPDDGAVQVGQGVEGAQQLGRDADLGDDGGDIEK